MLPDQNERTRGFLVSGRVQGVGFRWWTRLQASRLELSGTVRNLADGRVEVRVCGSIPAVEELERRLRTGPRAAAVDGLEAFDVEEPLLPGFRVIS
ncbi:MAG: acylphosphatase [Gemmatimonadota bacterium]|nr:acylphosphatase [Gemmatimonadota bacterium]